MTIYIPGQYTHPGMQRDEGNIHIHTNTHTTTYTCAGSHTTTHTKATVGAHTQFTKTGIYVDTAHTKIRGHAYMITGAGRPAFTHMERCTHMQAARPSHHRSNQYHTHVPTYTHIYTHAHTHTCTLPMAQANTSNT